MAEASFFCHKVEIVSTCESTLCLLLQPMAQSKNEKKRKKKKAGHIPWPKS
jgi:hypothetical protein